MSDDPAKAFKAAFGVSSTGKDWDKMLVALNRTLAKFKTIVDSMQTLEPGSPEAQAGLQAYTAWASSASVARSNFRQDKSRTGVTIRDGLLPQLLQDLNTHRKAEKQMPLTVMSSGKPQKVFRTDIPGYDSMDPATQQVNAWNAANSIRRGKVLYNDIIAGKKAGIAAQPQEVIDLAWALKSSAQQKNGPYEKGAMTVPNGLELQKFLDSCAEEIYPRKSSHLPDEQNGTGKSPRGMDFYDPNGNGPGLLPAGMNTLLFQLVDAPNKAKALYIKMETEGAYGSGNDNKKYDNTAPNPRPSKGRIADTTALIKHGWNYVKPRENSDPDIATTREDAPKELQVLVKTILNKLTHKQAKAILKAAIGKSMRINAVYAALYTIYRRDLFDGVELSDLEALDDFVSERYGAKSLADLEGRFGDEVVLGPNDIN